MTQNISLRESDRISPSGRGRKKSAARAAVIPLNRSEMDSRSDMDRDPGDEAALDPTPETVGGILHAARLEQGGKPIADIAHDLRIRPHLLEALEADDYDKLPGLIYAAGFLRAYAQYLGLDGATLVERLKESGRAQTLEAQLLFPQPLQDPRIPRRPLVVLACLMALVVYGAWYALSGKDDEALDGIAAPGPEFDQILKAEATAEAPPVETPAAGAPVEMAEAEEVTADEIAPEAEQPSETAAAEPEATQAQQVTLRASAPAWIRIEGPDSRIVVDRVLQPGEEFRAPANQGLVMQTGNAGALEITVDGRTIGRLGPDGAVRRQVALDQSLIATN